MISIKKMEKEKTLRRAYHHKRRQKSAPVHITDDASKALTNTRNIRGLMQMRIMLKREMIAAGTFTTEAALVARVKSEWEILQRKEQEDLRRLSRVTFQFYTPPTVDVSAAGESASREETEGGESSSGEGRKGTLESPLVPFIFNRHVLVNNNNPYAALWDRIAAYQIVKAYSPPRAPPLAQLSSNSTSSTAAATAPSSGPSAHATHIDKLALFANFPNDSAWLAAVRQCQEAAIAKIRNPLQDLHQPLAPPIPGRIEGAPTVTPLEYIAAGGAGGEARNSWTDMKKVAVVMSQFRRKKGEEETRTGSQTQTPSSLQVSLNQSAARSSVTSSVGNSISGGVSSDEEGEEDAYMSDDDQLRGLLEEETLADGIEDEGEKRDDGQSHPMKAPTGQENHPTLKYRNIFPDPVNPACFHVYIPLPSYRYKLERKQVALDREAFHFVKKRNREKLEGKFPSKQEAVLAYDACVRRLYNYEGFSFTKKKESNEWQFGADQAVTRAHRKKRSLRAFSGKHQQHRRMASDEVSIQCGRRDSVTKQLLPFDGPASAVPGGGSAGPPPKRAKAGLEIAPDVEVLDREYNAYIEESLRRLGSGLEINSFGNWRRRCSLVDSVQGTLKSRREKAQAGGAGAVVEQSSLLPPWDRSLLDDELGEGGALPGECSDVAVI